MQEQEILNEQDTEKTPIVPNAQRFYSDAACSWINGLVDTRISEVWYSDGVNRLKVVRANPFGNRHIQVVVVENGTVTSLTVLWNHPFIITLADTFTHWNKEI